MIRLLQVAPFLGVNRCPAVLTVKLPGLRICWCEWLVYLLPALRTNRMKLRHIGLMIAGTHFLAHYQLALKET